MDNLFKKNIVSFTTKLKNTSDVLLHFVQEDVISDEEYQILESKPSDREQNSALVFMLRKKDERKLGTILKILEDTGNGSLRSWIEEIAKQERLQHLISVKSSSTIMTANIPREEGCEKKKITDIVAVEKEPSHLVGVGVVTMEETTLAHPKQNEANVFESELAVKSFIGNVSATTGGTGIQNNFYFAQANSKLGTKKLEMKWWHNVQPLIKSLLERKDCGKPLAQVIHEKLSTDEKRTVVICESETASKRTGKGGIGKTLTAKWYANAYQDEYDHVIWIDCGEDSLLRSFTKLARYLDIKNRLEILEVEEFSMKSYQELQEFKCLWIFDNAESYTGKGGIQKILPKGFVQFYCLITSRSAKWGSENAFGKISSLALSIFSEEESLELLHNELKIQKSEKELKELCVLLGNHPLALQLAITALNEKQMNLHDYMEDITKNLDDIVKSEFDDYERTINANVKTSINLILKEECGQAAVDILHIFGYIRPDHVDQNFFQHILNVDMKRATDLLVQYAMISKENMREWKVHISRSSSFSGIWDVTVLSIHRLLQQVIRYYSRETKNEILRKILGCQEFMEYKFISFTMYADKQLQQEFVKVQAELLDQYHLMKLIQEKKFEECTQVAKFICNELRTNTSVLNYTICLDKNGQYEEAVSILKILYCEAIEDCVDYNGYDDIKMGILNLSKDVSKEVVAGFLLSICWRNEKKNEVKEILEKRKQFNCIRSEDAQDAFLQILCSSLIASNYSLQFANNTILLKLDGEDRKITISGPLSSLVHSVDLKIPLPVELQELKVYKVEFRVGNNPNLGEWIPKTVNKLSIRETSCLLSSETLSSIQYLHLLQGCVLNLDSPHLLSPVQLEFRGVSFLRDGKELEQVLANDFIDFTHISQMQLNCFPETDNIAIDMSSEWIHMDYLELEGAKLLNWEESKWNVDQLELWNIPFVEKTQMEIKQLGLRHSSLDLSCLSKSLEKLTLRATNVECSDSIELPHLKFFQFDRMDDCSLLSHFTAIQITHIQFDEIPELNVDLLPITVKQVKITNGYCTTAVTGGVRKLVKLFLVNFPFVAVQQVLKHLPTEHLVVEFDEFEHSYVTEVDELVVQGVKTIAFGRNYLCFFKHSEFKTLDS